MLATTRTKKPLASGGDTTNVQSPTPQKVMEATPHDAEDENDRDVIPRVRGTGHLPAPNPAYIPFANALRSAMIKQRLTASEIARRVWGTNKDIRGYEVARNRDRIGHYLAGRSYPEAENLKKLAEAVGVAVETLAVNAPARPSTREPRGLNPSQAGAERENGTRSDDMRVFWVGGDFKEARVWLNRVVKTETAMKIVQLLKEDVKDQILDVLDKRHAEGKDRYQDAPDATDTDTDPSIPDAG